jgi:hypothetical protein
MKKSTLMGLWSISIFLTSSIHAATLPFEEAKIMITKKIEKTLNSYNEQDCPITTQICRIINDQQLHDEAWEVAQDIIENILPQLPIYQHAHHNPHDLVYWTELTIQASMVAGQYASQIRNTFEFGAKVGGIVGNYIELLKEELQKNK